MTTKLKTWLIALGGVICTLIIFWVGVSVGTRAARHATATAIDDIQASLAFNRVLEGRKLESLLSRGCTAAAAKEVDILLDQDTKLLASLYRGKLSPATIKYIDDRDPKLLKTLGTFKSKYGEIWQEPECPQK